MTDVLVARDSVQLIGVQVAATTVAGTTVDPTAYAVAVAVLPYNTDDPTDADFKAAAWQSGSLGKYAVVMVGPDTTVGALSPGRYRLWVKVTASPEVPVIRSPDHVVVY